jgi:HEAT repeat protein
MKRAPLIIAAMATSFVVLFTGCASVPSEVKYESDALRSDNSVQKAYAASRLGKTPEKAGYLIPELIEVLTDEASLDWYRGRLFVAEDPIGPPLRSGAVRTTPAKEAHRTLVAIGEPSIEHLIRALGDGRSTIRKWSAITLGVLRDDRATGPLEDLLSDEDTEVRIEAANALAALDRDRGTDALILALGDPDPAVRSNAARILGRLQAWEAVEPLIELISDEDYSVALEAIRALLDSTDFRAYGAFAEAMEHPDPLIRREAVKGLHYNPNMAEADLLVEALSDEDSEVREHAARTLSLLTDPSLVLPLIDKLSDRNYSVQYWAAEALGRIGDRRAVEPLIDKLGSDVPYIWEMARTSLKRITGQDFGPRQSKWRKWLEENR